jgi:hypothetical protein
MIHPHTRTARTLLALASLVAGCDVFDAKLYKNSTPDMATTTQGDGGGPIVDLGPIDPDAGGFLCGRTTPATLCPAAYLFCDGFEDESGTMFSSWTNFLIQNASPGPINKGTNLFVDNSPVCLGQKVLHATTVGATQQAFLYEHLATPPSTLHVRFYFYMKQYSMQPFQIVGFHASSNAMNAYATLNIDPINSTLNYANGFGSMVGAKFSGAQLPVNQWLCLELSTQFDVSNGDVQLALDGTKLGEANIPTQPNNATLDDVNVGIIYTNPGDTGTNDVFIDEVAFSDQPIGCL